MKLIWIVMNAGRKIYKILTKLNVRQLNKAA